MLSREPRGSRSPKSNYSPNAIKATETSGARATRSTLVDAGAESPRETWLRLLLIKAGYPPPQTQIPVYGQYGELVAVVDMGWEDIKLALEYEGDHHRTDRREFNRRHRAA